MKQFYLSLGKWLISAGIVLLPAWAAARMNNIEMQSYFPTPYITYNNVFVSKQFDVGTSTGGFSLSLGSSNKPSLKTDLATLMNKTTLSFGDVQMKSDSVTFGSSQTGQVENAELTFNNLRIRTLSNAKEKPVQEINAKEVNVTGNMYLMEDKFSTLGGAALPGCEKTVSWQELTLGNGPKSWYLVCGDPVEGGDTPTNPCPSGKYKWELAGPDLTCMYTGDGASYSAIIDNALNDGYVIPNYALAHGIIQQSKCLSGGEQWNSGNSLYWVEYGLSSLCVHHQPNGSGEVCLEIQDSSGSEGHFSIPYCMDNDIPSGIKGWDPQIDCVRDESITWFEGNNGDNMPQISLYKAACVSD